MTLRFTLRQLEYFVAVGEMGSIALAAEKVNVSSPSISAAISQIEKEFGLPLFVRHHAQGLSLTLSGREMMTQAKLVLQAAERLVDLAGDISGKVQGPLSIGGLLTFAQMVVPALRAGFERANPDVRITQYELDQAQIFSKLRRGEIDLALTYDLDLPGDLKFLPIATLPPFAIFAADHPLAARDQVTVQDLLPHPMVLLDLPFSSEYFLSFFGRQGARPQIAERTRDMAVMRSLVANGFGFSIVNVRPLNDQSPDGKPLRFIPLQGEVRAMNMGVLSTPEAENANVIKAFMDHCLNQSQNGGLPVLTPTSQPVPKGLAGA